MNPPKQNPALGAVLVLLCTIVGAAAQILMKNGSQGQSPGVMNLLAAIFTNRQLFFGYALYGLSTVMLIIALKFGELSRLYPIFALTYVWVTGLSLILYGEQLNPLKVLGLLAVIAGVVVIGLGSRRSNA